MKPDEKEMAQRINDELYKTDQMLAYQIWAHELVELFKTMAGISGENLRVSDLNGNKSAGKP